MQPPMQSDQLASLYRDGWQRRDQITSEVDTPCTLVTILGGILAFLLTSFSFQSSWLSWGFGLMLALPVLFGILAVWNIARAYHGYEYALIPTGKELIQYRETLSAHFSGFDDAERLVEKAFEKYLADTFAESEQINSENNVSRAAYLYAARRWIILTVIATAACAVPWSADKMLNGPERVGATKQSPAQDTIEGEKR